MQGKTKMNKKIASEIAIGITLLLATIVGAIFLFQNNGQESLDNVKKIENKSVVKPVEIIAGNDNQLKNLDDESSNAVCVGRLYEGEASLKGTYVLDTIPGSTKKEWMFKVAKEDIDKLPTDPKNENNIIGGELLFIADASADMTAKLKKSTQENPETITIKGFYFDCEGVPVVSIQPARLALAKYIKK